MSFFTEGFEGGDKGNFDAEAESPPDQEVTFVTSRAFRGSYSALCHTSGDNEIAACYEGIGAQNIDAVYMRCYFQIDVLSANSGDYWKLFRWRDDNAATLGYAGIYYDGSDYKAAIYNQPENGGSGQGYTSAAITISADTWYRFEVYYYMNASGAFKVWFNDAAQGSPDIDQSSKDTILTGTELDRIWVGNVYTRDQAGSPDGADIYIDEVEFSTAYIGEEAATTTTTTTTSTTSTSTSTSTTTSTSTSTSSTSTSSSTSSTTTAAPTLEYVQYDLTAGTDIQMGRYLAVIRARDTNQIPNDLAFYVENTTDSSYRNEENEEVTLTLTSSYAYYNLVFDVTDADVDGGDTIRIGCYKSTGWINEIYVDDFIVVPIGNGESYPQDLAHNALREVNQKRRMVRR